MARVTVEDCLEQMPNRFELVMVASKRARDLALGAADPLVPWEDDKSTVVALREIAEGLIDTKILDESTVEDRMVAFLAKKPAFRDAAIDTSADFDDL